jgi:hypothetical protein
MILVDQSYAADNVVMFDFRQTWYVEDSNMEATAGQVEVREQAATEGVRPAGGVLFDWLAAAICAMLVGGFYLDAWAHNHGQVDQTFFTPWHAVLYSGLLFSALGVAAAMAWYHNKGYAWSRALPDGYELSMLGVALFALGGAGDLTWHQIFGIELNLDAAFSPTHILLAVAMGLIVSGPLRAGWRRVGALGGPAEWLPVVLSLTYTLSVFTVITQWLHPFVQVWAGQNAIAPSELVRGLAAAGIWVQTGLLMGLVLLALRRWMLPFGSLALIFTLNATLLSFMHDHYEFILLAFVAGLVGDVLVLWLKPSVARPTSLRLFAFVVPVVLYGLYFLLIIFTEGTTWSVHMWTGTVATAGVVGLLLSYLVVPPAGPPLQVD